MKDFFGADVMVWIVLLGVAALVISQASVEVQYEKAYPDKVDRDMRTNGKAKPPSEYSPYEPPI